MTIAYQVLSCLHLLMALSQHPGVRNGHAMAYHEGMRAVLMFGGANEKEVLGDLWMLDDGAWRRMESAGPQPRTFASLVYDPGEDRLILFGGNKVLFGPGRDSTNFLNDTWEWRNRAWRRLDDGDRPTPRSEAAMTFDPRKRRILLYGGYRFDGKGNTVRLYDTWSFENNRWRKISERGTASSNGVSIVPFDNGTRIIAYGGNRPRIDSLDYASTWEFKDNTWVPMKLLSPYYFNAAMSYDVHENFVLRFGGWNGQQRLNETSLLRDSQWKSLAVDGPSARNHSRLVYDAREKHHVLFGGHNGDFVFGDTWIFQKGAWKKVIDCEPMRRIDNGH